MTGGGALATGGNVSSAGGSASLGGSSAAGSGNQAARGGAPSTGGSAVTGGGAGVPAPGGAGGSGGSGGASTGGGGSKSGPLRIMPLGDSTTGSACWRANLWQLLNRAGYTGTFDFVGTRSNDSGCGVAGYDQDNEGHPGELVTRFVNDADDQVTGVQTVQELLGRNAADVALLHFATNDVWNGIANPTILAAYSTVLSSLRQANPSVVVLVAQLIPMVVTASTCAGCSCAGCTTRIPALNTAISAWAASNSTAASPVVVVDQFSNFDANAGADTSDGVHPNASGSSKIASKWAQALTPYF